MTDRTPTPTPDPHRNEPLPEPQKGVRPEADGAVRPEQDEPLGPVAELFGAAASTAEAEAAPGLALEAEAELEELGVEDEGIASGQILGIVTAILVSVLALVIVLYFLLYVPNRDATRISMANEPENVEIRDLRASSEARLLQYGVSEDSTFYIPIGRAMGIVSAEYSSQTSGSEYAARAATIPTTRQAFNTLPVQLHPVSAVRQAQAEGAAEAQQAPVEVGPDGEALSPTGTEVSGSF